jgi:hypothetical protein
MNADGDGRGDPGVLRSNRGSAPLEGRQAICTPRCSSGLLDWDFN